MLLKKRWVLIVVICMALLVCLTPLLRIVSLNGRWCLYIGKDIQNDEILSTHIDDDTFMSYLKNVVYFVEDNKAGEAVFHTSITNKLYIGDGVFEYKIRRIHGEKVLIRTDLNNQQEKTDYYIYVGPSSE